LNKNIDFMIL